MNRLFRTDPKIRSTPLPEGWRIELPQPPDLNAEIRRATTELFYALHRQRTTWARLAHVKAELGERNIEFLDNERPYKLAVGDVQWWRGEVSSRSNALTALLSLAAAMDIDVRGAQVGPINAARLAAGMGSQVGDGNTQTNACEGYGDCRLDVKEIQGVRYCGRGHRQALDT